MESIGARLREERMTAGLSQAAFARLGCVEVNAQGNYESGKRLPRVDYLAALAKGGVDLLYVITGQRTPLRLDVLSGEETAAIERFRLLDAEAQQAFGHLLQSLSR